MSRGHKLIAIDGVNKSGKTTAISGVVRWMEGQGRQVATIREPGGTPMAEQIRSVLLSGVRRAPETDVLLSNAARAETVRRIRQLLSRSDVLADRSYLSTLAIQIHGDGAPDESTRQICRYALGDGYKPDAYFLLDISYDAYLERLAPDDPPDYFEKEDREHFERIRQGFLIEAERIDAYIIDAAKPSEEVRGEIATILGGIL